MRVVRLAIKIMTRKCFSTGQIVLWMIWIFPNLLYHFSAVLFILRGNRYILRYITVVAENNWNRSFYPRAPLLEIKQVHFYSWNISLMWIPSMSRGCFSTIPKRVLSLWLYSWFVRLSCLVLTSALSRSLTEVNLLPMDLTPDQSELSPCLDFPF